MKNEFKISVIVPAYNEELTLIPLCVRLLPVLDAFESYEVIFVDV